MSDLIKSNAAADALFKALAEFLRSPGRFGGQSCTQAASQDVAVSIGIGSAAGSDRDRYSFLVRRDELADLFECLYAYLDPYVDGFFPDRVSLFQLDKEVDRLLESIRFEHMLEQGEDRIYMEGLRRAVRRVRERLEEARSALQQIDHSSVERVAIDSIRAHLKSVVERYRLALSTSDKHLVEERLDDALEALSVGQPNFEEVFSKHVTALEGALTLALKRGNGGANGNINDARRRLNAIGDDVLLLAQRTTELLTTARERTKLLIEFKAWIDKASEEEFFPKRPTSTAAVAHESGDARRKRKDTDTTRLAEWEGAEGDFRQLRQYLGQTDNIVRKLERLGQTINSTNAEEMLVSALRPVRKSTDALRTSFFYRVFPLLLVAGLVAVPVAYSVYLMSLTPWWRPFSLILLFAPLLAYFTTKAVRHSFHGAQVSAARRAFALTLYPVKDVSKNEERTQDVRQDLAHDDFRKGSRVYWRFDIALFRRAVRQRVIERSLSGRLKGTRRDRLVRWFGDPDQKIRSMASIVVAGFVAASFAAWVTLSFVAGRPFSAVPSIKSFEEPLSFRNLESVAVIIGSTDTRTECILSVGHIVWSGVDEINLRPMGAKEETEAVVSVIPRSSIKRIFYRSFMEPKAEPTTDAQKTYAEAQEQKPPEAQAAETHAQVSRVELDREGQVRAQVNLPDCMSPPAPSDGGKQVVRRNILAPLFLVKVKSANAPEVFRKRPPAIMNADLRQTLMSMGKVLSSCGKDDDFALDVMGFASDWDFQGRADSLDLNFALAEGRRREVLQLLAENGNVRVVTRGNPKGEPAATVLEKLEASPRSGDTQTWVDWAATSDALRFNSFSDMQAARNARFGSDGYASGDPANEGFVRGAIIDAVLNSKSTCVRAFASGPA